MTRQLQKIGNSKGVVLTRTMLEHLGADQSIEVTLEEGRIVLTAPQSESRRHSFEEACDATFSQYGIAARKRAA